MSVEPRIEAGLVASLIPLGFVIGFIAYAANKTTVSVFLLTAIAVMGAAVPFTVVIFAVSRRRDRSDRPSSRVRRQAESTPCGQLRVTDRADEIVGRFPCGASDLIVRAAMTHRVDLRTAGRHSRHDRVSALPRADDSM
ncbi:hypothetical protein [Saccharothrix deserti]|uniref:hypothetical protein n=1 Tax=Saccharothrix deserti TaxID=2593674 RepID=UPI00131CAEC7|nr:hypothetical protein [Saccharothrix deserti]